MLLTLLRDVVFLAWKKGPEGQAKREMLNTWLPHVLLVFTRTASLAASLFASAGGSDDQESALSLGF